MAATNTSGRRLRLYGVGGAKTGTHSLAAMFAAHYRSAHEPRAAQVVAMQGRQLRGELDRAGLDDWLLARDRHLGLEVDVSCLNHWFAADLARLFPDARFVLTLREPFGWLDSLYSQALSPSGEPFWREARRQAFGPIPARYPREEAWLADRGLHPIGACVAYWSRRNLAMLDGLPAGRLFVLRTRELRERAGELAEFCRIPVATLSVEHSHEFKGSGRVRLSEVLDPDYLRREVLAAGRPLLARCFPALLLALEAGRARSAQ